MTALPGVGHAHVAGLPDRLDALWELARIGRSREGFDTGLLDRTEEVLRRAGDRLRLSAGHTVVAIAGGTGSGKSTLFNALAGAEFSPPGVTRPTTRDVYACIWGTQGAGALLDWLGVDRRHRFARASALDAGEEDLSGLILLDLPDHDSVIATSQEAVDRISKLADMLIWVLDPQKYADAAVHNRYLIPLAGHADVFTVVLSQIDLLGPEELAGCEEDLRRLLDSEGLPDTMLIPVSARTREGLDALRDRLAGAVSASRAATERISADIDSVLAGYGAYAAGPAVPERDFGLAPVPAPVPAGAGLADPELADAGAGRARAGYAGAGNGSRGPKVPAKPPWEMTDEERAAVDEARRRPPWADATPYGPRTEPEPEEIARNVPDPSAAALQESFAAAAGLSAVTERLASAGEARGVRYTGWPVARVLPSRRDPMRLLREDEFADDSPAAGQASGGLTGDEAPRGGGRAYGGGRYGGGGYGAGRYGSGPYGGAETPPVGRAQQPEVDQAITLLADTVSGDLPEPWPESVRRAARSRADEVPAALADAVREAVPVRPKIPAWWRAVATWHWVLLALAAVALAWAVTIAVAHWVGGVRSPAVLGDVSLSGWLALMTVGLLLLGWLTGIVFQNMAVVGAAREGDSIERLMRVKVADVALDLVLVPVGRELGEYERFRHELAVARGMRAPG